MGNGIYMNCLPWTWKSHFEDTRWHFFLFSIWCEWYVWDTGQKDMDEHGFIVWAGRQMKKQRTRWCVNSTGTCGVPWSVSDYESRKLRIYTISLVCILCGDTGPSIIHRTHCEHCNAQFTRRANVFPCEKKYVANSHIYCDLLTFLNYGI